VAPLDLALTHQAMAMIVLTVAALHAASVVPARNEAKSAHAIAADFAAPARGN
jgi:heme A synthase